VNQTVARGQKLMALEAMKIHSNIYAPIGGRIAKVLVTANQTWQRKTCC
jgi:biotin carboxyl carrier protein